MIIIVHWSTIMSMTYGMWHGGPEAPPLRWRALCPDKERVSLPCLEKYCGRRAQDHDATFPDICATCEHLTSFLYGCYDVWLNITLAGLCLNAIK